MKDESPYERIMREGREREAARVERDRKAKENLRYGVVRMSSRRWRIIKYEGVSFWNAFSEHFSVPMHSFSFITEPLDWDGILKELSRLEKEHGPPT